MAVSCEEYVSRIQATRDEISEIRAKIEQRRTDLSDADLRSISRSSVPAIGRYNLRVRQTLKGHIDKVSAMHWSADRRHLVSASQDGKLIIWDAYTGNKVYAINLRSMWVMSCAYAPSGNFVASGGLENVCTIYKLVDHDATEPGGISSGTKTVRELTAHTGYISCCRFLSDERILTASGDKSCILFDIRTGAKIKDFAEHQGDVMSVDICPTNSNLFISGACDAQSKLWDLRQGSRSVQTFRAHKADINAVQFFPDGLSFGSGSDDATCRVFDIRADREITCLSVPDLQASVTSVAFSVSGRLMFAGYEDNECRVWDVLRGEKVASLTSHDSRISCLGLSNDGISLCTGSWDSTLKIWTP
ncbi:WD40-repeat-containing domain protein [Limtongia smithiae]|uniref:WD40-repeat-containing domain protein n=1 Tax=Limtongia smithiae TaxID=1125753 RepID=UPI0034CE78A4